VGKLGPFGGIRGLEDSMEEFAWDEDCPRVDWLEGFPFLEGKRYHCSKTPIEAYKETPQFERGEEGDIGFKPKGLWYGVGDAWVEWMGSDARYWLKDVQYLYEVQVPWDMKMLHIRSVQGLDEFDEDYGYDTIPPALRSHYSSNNAVHWKKVSWLWQGIEIAPYQRDRRMSLDWYYGWDGASGCVWGAGVKLELLATKPGV
jgi:hypothetical protein